jgi:hypothetical protein
MVLRRGVLMRVRMNDPNGYVAGRTSTTAAGILVGVRGARGEYYGAQITSSGPRHLEFSIVIPRGRKLDLWTHSRRYVLRYEDEQSDIQEEERRHPLAIPAGDAQTVDRAFTVVRPKLPAALRRPE